MTRPRPEPALERRCRGPGRPRLRAAGFTLIEVLVALAIVAIALAATSRAAGVAVDSALDTRQRMLATWAAQNRIAELRARRIYPPAATTRLATEQAGLAMVLEETVTDTPNPTMRRVDIAVAEARAPERVMTRLTAYVSQ